MFFAYVGFDAVSTAAEETKNPQRNVPIGLIGSLLICTIFYMLVTAGAVGAMGGQPVLGADGNPLPTGPELSQMCATPQYAEALVCSREPLAHVLHTLGYGTIGNLIGYAAFIALPSVILILLFGQTRIFFVMARDGLLPERCRGPPALEDAAHRHDHHRLTSRSPRPSLPSAAADIANAGTLYAF
jgi:APA family basic amino acid/polyamine antiporter